MTPEGGAPLALLDGWCRRHLGAGVARQLFRAGNLSLVVGLELDGGREVVAKLRPPHQRLVACARVQHELWQAGFPCPRPLAGPFALGDRACTVETLLGGGDQLPDDDDAPTRFGEALARLIRAAPSAALAPGLEPPPAWVRWNHDEPGPWPRPATTPVDLNAVHGPAWLDEAVVRARRRLGRLTRNGATVVGHADFESQNIRWLDGELHAVHDWDSAVALPEAVIVGAAAAMFPARDAEGAAAAVDGSAAFLEAYERGRGSPWSAEARQACWAAGLFALAYSAKIETVEARSGVLARLEHDVGERMRLAGA